MKAIRAFLFIIIFLPGAIVTIAQTPVSSGSVSGTWDIAGSPYMVNGEIYINNPDTLTIEAGVEVRFTGWYKFIVHGSLLAEGTASDQILFTAEDTNNRWHGIRFMYATGTSVLDHCIVEYGLTLLGGPSLDPDYYGGGVLCYYSAAASITIKNSIIRNNIADIGGGIQCYRSSILIDNCEIIHNEAHWGGGIELEKTSGAVILKSSTIAYNSASSYGGGIFAAIQANMEIIGNVIIHNSAGHYGGGIRILNPSRLIVRENIIAHNHAWWDGGGIGIWNADTIGTFKDNTIAYNHAVLDGGGAFVDHNCSPSFESNIIYFNTSGSSGFNQVHLNGTGGAPFFNYCDVQDSCTGFSGIGAPSFPGSTHFLNCIDANPQFADPDNDDFSLTWANYPEPDNTRSTCIDSGKPAILPEPDGSCNDIGAFFFFQQLDVPLTQEAVEITDTSFQSQWSSAFGALGYLLDVAEDDVFTMYVIENQQIQYDTSYVVGGLSPGLTYYYRVRSFNSIDTSDYSDVTEVSTIATGINDPNHISVKAYCSNKGIHILTNPNLSQAGEVRVYNLNGSLLKRNGLNPGHNLIDLNICEQIVIVQVNIGEKVYRQKLLVR